MKTIAVGIDSVAIKRFMQWHLFNYKQLHKVFGQQEIVYCLENNIKSAERFAVRFAAKEALYKALSSFYQQQKISFTRLLQAVCVAQTNNGAVQLIIDWHKIGLVSYGDVTTLLSLTHTEEYATAIVMLQQADIGDI